MDKKDAKFLSSDYQYTIEKIDNKPPSIDDIPEYRTNLKLSDEQQERLTAQFRDEFKSLQDERARLGLDGKWAERDRQYAGELKPNKKLTFNLHTHQTKIKEDAIVRALNEAFLDSEPMVDVSPRPEMQRQDGQEVCEKQKEFIDYEMDENIRPQATFVLINHSTVRKYVGIGKVDWDYCKDRRRREEVYEGKLEPMMQNGKPVMGQDKQPQMENVALKEFMSNYPDANEQYPQIVKQIASGKKVTIVVEYLDVVANNGKLKYVRIEDFWVANSTKGLSGLKKAHLVVERENYRWSQLEAKERNDEFENIESMASGDDKEFRDYSVYEATTYFRLKDGDKTETKIKAWFGETSSKSEANKQDVKDYILLGAILYPYFVFDIDYIPFWVTLNDKGFYGNCESVVAAMKDSNIAQDAIMNMMLDGAFKRNTLTPIVREGSEIEQQFLENRWFDGKPLSIDSTFDDVTKGIGFVQYPQHNFAELVGLKQILQKQDSDVSGVTDLMTGRESQSDPRAPATKTLALLNQSGINIKDYIRVYLPSFNEFVGNVLGLYYQMSQEGRKFQVGARAKRVSGVNPFSMIRRDEMIAKTTIQARAAAFAFDKVNEKNENMAALQLVQTNPYLMQNPRVQYEAVKIALESWSPMWKNFAASKLPSPEEFAQDMQKAAIEAVMMVMQGKQQESQATGIPPQPPQMSELTPAVHQAQMEKMNPALKAEREKAEE